MLASRPKLSLPLMIVVSLGTASCAAPRSQTQSGRVVPQGGIRAGGDMTWNLSTSTADAILDGVENSAKEFADTDGEREYDSAIQDVTTAIVAYGLDPIGAGTDVYFRYGVYKRFDLGYKYASGTHVIDGRYQFMGPVAGPPAESGEGQGAKPAEEDGLGIIGAFYGNVGLQYSQQSFEFPSFLGLDKVAEELEFDFSRKDILVPITFSHSLGADEKFGALSYGAVYGYTKINYGFGPEDGFVKDLVDESGTAIPSIRKSQGFSSFGVFANAKLGFKYAYVIAALSVYYQDFGKYEMLGQATTELSGFTVIPSLGIELDLD